MTGIGRKYELVKAMNTVVKGLNNEDAYES